MIYREFPETSNSFLRHQLLQAICRPEQKPVYDGGKLVGMENSGKEISVQRLVGFGKTLRRAERMAKVKV